MTCRLCWIVNARAGCFHAANAAARRLPLVEPSVCEALAAPVAAVEDILAPTEVTADAFWRSAVPLSIEIEDDRRLIDEISRREAASVHEAIALPLSKAVGAIESAARGLWPQMEEELRLRQRPLREQWEARGPGFLRRLSQLAEPAAVPPEAGVVLVPPCLGGGGEAHPEFGLVRLEAVLANAWLELPEALRLGWLVAQLGKERPSPPLRGRSDAVAAGWGEVSSNDNYFTTASNAENAIPHDRRRMVNALAMLPLALEAGEYVEWTRADRRTLEAALTAWRPSLPDGASPAEIAEVLDTWRRRSLDESLSWETALSALDARL
jgi:hypothetical protein